MNKKNVLLIDAGDLLFKKYKNPIQENEMDVEKEKAQLMIESFNLMGLNAMAIGDDDLTLGKNFLIEISKKARFPFVNSNIVDEESEKPIFTPYLLKEINGIKIGIFGLISEHLFLTPYDPRKKGIKIAPPIDIASNIINELKPKAEIIILLSHLSYPKDIEFLQYIKGINFIFGSHLGANLSFPPIIQNTVILQSAPKGMYGAHMDLILNNNEPFFYNLSTKKEMVRRIKLIQQKLTHQQLSESEKDQLLKTKKEYENVIKEFSHKNEFSIYIIPLNDQIREDSEISGLVEKYKIKTQSNSNKERGPNQN